MNTKPYKRLAERLDALPNGFPPSEDGVELRLLAKLFRPEEAALASELRLTHETPQQIADRIGVDPTSLRLQLKNMARRGLIAAGRTEKGLGYGLLPFAVGIYEMQFSTIDVEFAQLFEDYYHKAFNQALTVQPSIHRVIPVNVSIRNDMEVRPFESATEIVSSSKAWGVINCLCRTQKALICINCGTCVERCQFNALALDDILRVNNVRCVGCGVCVLACQEGALHLVRRPVGEIVEPPLTEAEWRKERATARSLDLSNVL
jgi:ferredoxin